MSPLRKSSGKIRKKNKGTQKSVGKRKARRRATPKRKSTKKLSERRVQSRVPVQLEIQYRVKETFMVDLTQDISPGGIFIPTNRPLPKNTQVELKFGLPDDERFITAEGKVVWAHIHQKSKGKGGRQGMGVEFTRIDFEGQKFIDDIINDFLRKVSLH